MSSLDERWEYQVLYWSPKTGPAPPEEGDGWELVPNTAPTSVPRKVTRMRTESYWEHSNALLRAAGHGSTRYRSVPVIENVIAQVTSMVAV